MTRSAPRGQQLSLPLAGISLPGEALRIARADRVFVNRNLQLTGIDWVGFDMDYTLAIYRQAEMDALSVGLILERLVRRGWPSSLLSLDVDPSFPIRGLLIDKRHGHVLKMDRHKVVHHGYHGLRRLAPEELVELYHHRRIRPHTSRYHWIDTLFELSEVTAFVTIVDALERRGVPLDYARLWSDVRSSIDEAHRDGTVYARVVADLDRYLERDPLLARTLHKFRSAGKRLFLLTNSPWHYTETLLGWLLDGALAEYPTFRHYFDVMVVSAAKPLWFQAGRPLMEREGDLLRVARSIERGRVYEGGNLADFERMLGVVGSTVLYVGDHIYGDMLRSKKESSWRTAMIIPELDQELVAHEASVAALARCRQLLELRERFEDELRYHQQRFKEASRRADADAREAVVLAKRAVDQVRAELRAIDREEASLRAEIDQRFHPFWGSLLKEHNERSSFGLQVDTYADVYTRRVSCFHAYSPMQSFRSPHDQMPHEL